MTFDTTLYVHVYLISEHFGSAVRLEGPSN